MQEVNGIVMMSANLRDEMHALWEGTIELTESGCVGLLTPAAGTEVVPVLWPGGSAIAADGESFEIDGTTYRLGDSFTGGGGESATLPVDPDPACEADSYILLNAAVS